MAETVSPLEALKLEIAARSGSFLHLQHIDAGGNRESELRIVGIQVEFETAQFDHGFIVIRIIGYDF